MTNETIGHFALHPGTNTVGWSEDKGFFGDIQTKAKQIKIQPSELELRIRKEVLDAVNIMSELLSECEQCNDNWGMSCSVTSVYIEHITNIKDRLNLLWGK